jgi:hypothetical protein
MMKRGAARISGRRPPFSVTSPVRQFSDCLKCCSPRYRSGCRMPIAGHRYGNATLFYRQVCESRPVPCVARGTCGLHRRPGPAKPNSGCCQPTRLSCPDVLYGRVRRFLLAEDQSARVAPLVPRCQVNIDILSRLPPGGSVPADSHRSTSPLRQLALDDHHVPSPCRPHKRREPDLTLECGQSRCSAISPLEIRATYWRLRAPRRQHRPAMRRSPETRLRRWR